MRYSTRRFPAVLQLCKGAHPRNTVRLFLLLCFASYFENLYTNDQDRLFAASKAAPAETPAASDPSRSGASKRAEDGESVGSKSGSKKDKDKLMKRKAKKREEALNDSKAAEKDRRRRHRRSRLPSSNDEQSHIPRHKQKPSGHRKKNSEGKDENWPSASGFNDLSQGLGSLGVGNASWNRLGPEPSAGPSVVATAEGDPFAGINLSNNATWVDSPPPHHLEGFATTVAVASQGSTRSGASPYLGPGMTPPHRAGVHAGGGSHVIPELHLTELSPPERHEKAEVSGDRSFDNSTAGPGTARAVARAELDLYPVSGRLYDNSGSAKPSPRLSGHQDLSLRIDPGLSGPTAMYPASLASPVASKPPEHERQQAVSRHSEAKYQHSGSHVAGFDGSSGPPPGEAKAGGAGGVSLRGTLASRGPRRHDGARRSKVVKKDGSRGSLHDKGERLASSRKPPATHKSLGKTTAPPKTPSRLNRSVMEATGGGAEAGAAASQAKPSGTPSWRASEGTAMYGKLSIQRPSPYTAGGAYVNGPRRSDRSRGGVDSPGGVDAGVRSPRLNPLEGLRSLAPSRPFGSDKYETSARGGTSGGRPRQSFTLTPLNR